METKNRILAFSTLDMKFGLINSDGTGERYPVMPVEKGTRWSAHSSLFPEKYNFHLVSYDEYTLEKNLLGQLHTRLWKYNILTGDLTEFLTGNRPAPMISVCSITKDGKRCICQAWVDKSNPIYIVDIESEEWVNILPKEEGYPYCVSLSPDEKRLAFHITSQNGMSDRKFVPSGYSINTISLDGSDRKLIAGEKGHLYFWPKWSPDGKWLAYLDCHVDTDPAHYFADVCIAKPDGSLHKVVTSGQCSYFGTTFGSSKRRGGGSNGIVWTHDNKLLYSKIAPGSHPDAMYKPELGNHRENEFCPEKAHGGSWICMLDPFTGEEKDITIFEEGRWDFHQSISSNGKEIAYTSAKVGEPSSICVAGVEDGRVLELTYGCDGLGVDFARWIEF